MLNIYTQCGNNGMILVASVRDNTLCEHESELCNCLDKDML